MFPISSPTIAKFPDELKPIIKETGSKREKHLIEVLTNVVIREAFKNWAVQNMDWVKASPCMSQIVQVVQEFDDLVLNDGGISLFIHTYILPFFRVSKDKSQLCDAIEKKEYDFADAFNKKEILSNVPLVIGYINLGFLDISQIIGVLSLTDDNETPLIHQTNTVKMLIPTFERLSLIEMNRVLSINNRSGFMGYEQHLQDLLPVLEKRPIDELILILSIKNEWGRYLYEKHLQYFLPILEKRPIDEIIQIFTKEITWRGCMYEQHFQDFLPILEKRPINELIQILTIKVRDGRCLCERYLDDLLPILQKLPIDELIQILTIKIPDGGILCALYVDVLLPVLEKCPIKELIQILSLEVRSGITPSSFGHGIPNEFAIDWLLQKTPKELGPEYLELEKIYKEKEQQLLEHTERQLLEKFPVESANQALEFCLKNRSLFISVNGIKELSKPLLLQREFESTGQALGTTLEATTFLNLETFSKADLPACMKAIESFMQKYRTSLDRSADYMKKFRMAKNVESDLNKQLAAILLFDEKTAGFCTCTQQLHLLKVKNEFNRTLTEFVEELSKHPLEIGCDMTRQLPSEACELARCQKYNSDVLGNRAKILLKILSQLGVTEKIS